MKYIFFGSPKFAAIILEKLIEAGLVPEAVVCNPDELTGRKKILTPPPVKQLILDKKINIPVWQPEKLEIDKLGGIDFAIIAAYGRIIPKIILDSLPAKFIGVHPSLLPKYRGPSPIQTAILNGEKQTGVDLFLIDKETDHGPILASAKCEISEKDNYETMTEKLANLGAKLLIENLPKYLSGEIKPKEQNHSEATFTKKFETEDGYVELPKYLTVCHSRENGNPESEKTWFPHPAEGEARMGRQVRNDKTKENSAELIFNKIRALNPDPGVFAFIKIPTRGRGSSIPKGIGTKTGEKRVKLLEANLINGKPFDKAQDKLELLKVQPEGKKPMSYKDFLNGLR